MKRFLSIILALALVLSLAPMTFATEGEATTIVYSPEYVFTGEVSGITGDLGKQIASFKFNGEKSSGVWGPTDQARLQVTFHMYETGGTQAYVGATSTGVNCFPMNITVDADGTYIPTLNYQKWGYGGQIKMYIVDKTVYANNKWKFSTADSVNAIVAASGIDNSGVYCIADVDSWASTNEGWKPAEGKAIELKAGEYYLMLSIGKGSGKSTHSSERYYAFVSSLKLDRQPYVSVSAETTGIKNGETTKLFSSAKLGDDTDAGVDISYSVAPEGIVSVDSDGTITALAAGDATITASATIGGKVYTDTLDIKVNIAKHHYVFKSGALGYDANISFTEAAADKGAYSAKEGAYADSDKWALGAMRSAYAGGIYTNSNAFYFSVPATVVDDVVTIKINVPGTATKTYAPMIKYEDSLSYGGTADIFIFKGNKNEILSDKYCISNEDNGRHTGLAAVSKELKDNGAEYKIATITTYPNSEDIYNNIELAPGDYWLAIVPTGGSRSPYKNKYHYKIQSLTLTETTEPRNNSVYFDAFNVVEEKYSDAPLSSAKVSTFVAYLGETKDSESADVVSSTVTLGEKFTVNAEEKEGYKFLYWAKGMSTERKQIVSYNAEYSFVPTVENTYLIAVYEPETPATESAKAEFYNGNGQLLATLTENGNAPALPEMAGYGIATGWKLYGTDEIIEGGAAVEISGTKLYVAQYNNLSEDCSITVTNGTGSGNYKYGQVVTCTPSGEGTFIGWKKDGKLVSASSTYRFRAWETCTVEALYADKTPVFSGKKMKIIIDTIAAGGKTAVMAEFIGITNAVEKGIVFGTKHVAMTTDANQFTVINDTAETTEVYGYAIFKDGTIVYDR